MTRSCKISSIRQFPLFVNGKSEALEVVNLDRELMGGKLRRKRRRPLFETLKISSTTRYGAEKNPPGEVGTLVP